MPKVREVFARAYGPVPEGATCHVGYPDGHKGGAVRPTYRSSEGEAYAGCADPHKARWYWAYSEGIYGGDISECDAAAFSPVFQCAAYDAALDALTKEERAKLLAGRIGAMNLYSPTLYGDVWRKRPSPVLSTHLDVMGEGK